MARYSSFSYFKSTLAHGSCCLQTKRGPQIDFVAPCEAECSPNQLLIIRSTYTAFTPKKRLITLNLEVFFFFQLALHLSWPTSSANLLQIYKIQGILQGLFNLIFIYIPTCLDVSRNKLCITTVMSNFCIFTGH